MNVGNIRLGGCSSEGVGGWDSRNYSSDNEISCA